RQTAGIDFNQSPSTSDDRDGHESDSVSFSLSHELSSEDRLRADYSRTEAESEFDDGVNDYRSQRASLGAETYLGSNWNSSFSVSYFEDHNKTLSDFASESQTERVSAAWQNAISLSGSNIGFGLDYED